MLVTLVAVFISVALAAGIAVTSALTSVSAERKRLRAVTRAPDTTLPEIVALTNDPSAGGWQRAAPFLGLSKKDLNRLTLRMIRAGYEHPSAAIIYTLAELVLPLFAAAAPLLFWTGPRAYFGSAIAGGFMFFMPGIVVERALATRRRAIENGLADALDLLVVCIEAGLGLD